MELNANSEVKGEVNVISNHPGQVIVAVEEIPVTVLKRLMEEVKNDSANQDVCLRSRP